MPDFKPYDLGTVLRNVEAIKAMRNQNAMAPYERDLIELQTQNTREAGVRAQAGEQRAVAGENRAATEFGQEQQIASLRLLNAAAAEIEANPQAQARWAPQLKAAGIPDEVLAQPMDAATAKQIFESTGKALQSFQQTSTNRYLKSTQRDAQGNLVNFYSDGTTEVTGHDAAPTQGFRPTKLQLPDGRTIDAFLDGSNGALYGADGSMLSPPTRGGQAGQPGQPQPAGAAPLNLGQGRAPEDEARAVQTAKNESDAVADQKAELTRNQRTLEVWNVAKQGLSDALASTTTGPVSGRMPALTAGQQTADGAVASVAPVLKQLFRDAGEGVFTDRDQALLIAMVPTRTDHPETRQNKLNMIDALVQAKLAASVQGDEAPAPAQPAAAAPAAAPMQVGRFLVEPVE